MLARRALFIASSVAVLIALACAPAPSQTEVTIGTGTATGPYPLATFYHDARTQVIYLASEVGAPYWITALSLNVTTLPGQTMNNFTIRMKHTTLNSYSSPAWEFSDWTTVYQANETVTSAGWWKFTFATPFLYNGDDNLMVDFSFNNSTYTAAGYCCYSTPGGDRTIYQRTDSLYGDPLTWSGTSPAPVSTVNVPNVKLLVESAIRTATPTFSPDGGTYSSERSVIVSCVTPGATIHCTTNGIDPTESDPEVASGSTVPVDRTMTLKARAWAPTLAPSNVKSADYVLKVATPVFDPDAGNYFLPVAVTIGCSTPGAVTHYTTNGVDPTESDALTSGSVAVTGPMTLKARAYKPNWTPSDVKSGVYTAAKVVRVRPTGNDANDGLSCATAKKTVRAGLNAVISGDEVWVAGDSAHPYRERITLKLGVGLYGGFAGTETARSQRDWTANITALDGGWSGEVVTSPAGAISTTRIDGFGIWNGHASCGGGIYCYSSSPTITNNTIAGNSAPYGGGIYCYSSSPTITSNTIYDNSASYGAGIYCELSSPTVLNNTIWNNSASGDGGGIYCKYYLPTIAGNIIAYNSATYGGGIYSHASTRIVNNTLDQNAAYRGGGIYCNSGSPRISNNIIVGHNSYGVYCDGATPALRNNCLFWNDYSDYYGVSAGAGDIFRNPVFVDWYWGDYRLTASSPCREAGWNGAPGLPATDIDGDPRIYNGTVDIGADEFTPSPLSPSEAKKQHDSATVYLRGAVVSTASPDFFYVEAEDRSSGIRVDKTGHGLSVDTRACVEGIVTTDSAGECHIDAGLAANTGSGHVNPVGLTHRNLGGAACGLQAGVWSWQKVEGFTDPQWLQAIGLNNIGLLVTVFGNVTFAGADFFYLDDGSKLNDDSGHIGVKVSAPGLSIPSSGFVKVTGISSCEKKGADLVRVVRAIEIAPL